MIKTFTRSLWLITILSILIGSAIYLIAADHIDSPSVTGAGSDITDFYAFQSPSDAANMVFVVNVQGLLSPTATSEATFDEEIMVEINIDNSATKDNEEDLVIQATFNNGKVMIHGPGTPVSKGLTSNLIDAAGVSADITPYGNSPVIGEANGIRVFAGPRDDPFFFDLGAYQNIIDGMATEFNNPGTDTFAGTNVLSLVIEVPKSMLGNADDINTWVTTNRKM